MGVDRHGVIMVRMLCTSVVSVVGDYTIGAIHMMSDDHEGDGGKLSGI